MSIYSIYLSFPSIDFSPGERHDAAKASKEDTK